MSFYLSLILSVSLFIASVFKGQKKRSSTYIMDAEWLDQQAKFDLIARWGVK